MGASCSKDTHTGVVVAGIGSKPSGRDSAGDFLPFSQLNDDVILCILSYVSYAPFERDVSGTLTLSAISDPELIPSDDDTKRLLQDYNAGATRLNKKVFKRKSSLSPFKEPQYYYKEAFHGFAGAGRDEPLSIINSFHRFGTLTHVLPLVCKRFHLLCSQSDVLWTESLERLMGLRNSCARSDIGSCVLWEAGIASFVDAISNDVNSATPAEDYINGSGDVSLDAEHDKVLRLIAKACDCRNKKERQSQKRSVALEVFQQVLIHHKPVCLPVFSMFYPVSIGEEISIRLFEPRYRLLITEIMVGRSDREKSGFPLSAPRPRFLFACRSDDWDRAACIMEVRRCVIHQYGVADISIVPVAWTILESLTTRPESGGLLDGTLLRSPKRMLLPAFCMRTHMVLQQPIRLRLYEERYKILIAEVMAGRSDEERSGCRVSDPQPQFVFVCYNRFKEGDVACLVNVESCRVHMDGSAHVTVVPTVWVLIETLRVRPNSGKLYDASVLYPLPSFSRQD